MGLCSYKGCDKEAVVVGRCSKHYLSPRRNVRFGHDRERCRKTPFPGYLNDVRTVLVDQIAAAVGDYDRASAITDALDAYLATEPADRVPAHLWLPPNPRAELDKTKKQLDEAVARAEKAEQQLAVKKKKSKTP